MAQSYNDEKIISAAQMVSAIAADVARRSIPEMGWPLDRYFINETDVPLYLRFATKADGIDVAAGQFTVTIGAGQWGFVEFDRWAGEIQIAAPGATTGRVIVSIGREV